MYLRFNSIKMTKLLFSTTFLFSFFFLISCSDDGSTDPVESGADVLSETISVLTNNSQKSWRIQEAILINTVESNSLNVSNEFNIKDDVFVFSTATVENPELGSVNGSVTWKRREAVNWEASSIPETYKDFYENEVVVGFQILENNPEVFRAFEGLFDFTLSNENTITGKIRVSENVELELTLIPKTDTQNIPTKINFKEIGSYDVTSRESNVIGLKASNVTNTLYLGFRGPIGTPQDNCEQRQEDIVAFDLKNKTFTPNLLCQPSNFISREIEIIDGSLMSIASNSINTYDLNFNDTPSFDEFEETLTRHGSASTQKYVYIISSRLNTTNDNSVSDNLWVYDTESRLILSLYKLPIPKVWADAEIVDSKLYIFGGVESFPSDTIALGSKDILVFNLQTLEWDTLSMPKAINDTFAGRYKNFIFVGGNTPVDNDGDGISDGDESFLGVFNTESDVLSEVNYEFDGTPPANGIFRQLTVLNNKLYLIVETLGSGNILKIYEAELE